MSLSRKWVILPILMLIATLLLYISLPGRKAVTIIDGNIKVTYTTAKSSIKELLEEKDIALGEKDQIEPDIDSPLAPEMKIKIVRARNVEIVSGGQSMFVETTSYQTNKVLQEAGISLAESDQVYPPKNGYCLDSVRIINVQKKEVIEEKELAYTIEKVNDDKLYKGEQRIRQKGLAGLERYVYEVIWEDGHEVARKLLERVVVKKPVKQVVAVGTLQAVSRGGNQLAFRQALDMASTGYTHTGQKTYTGIWPTVGIVAVDPKVIPLRSRLYIDGYGYATAMDIGSSIKGNRIDLFFESRQEAIKWGRRNVKVFVLE